MNARTVELFSPKKERGEKPLHGVLNILKIKAKAKEMGVAFQKSDSDTVIFFKILNKKLQEKPLAESLKELLETDYYGDYTFVIAPTINSIEDVYVIKSGRPWVFHRTPFGLFGTSTEKMFTQALYYSGIDIPKTKIKKIETKENVLYKINKGGVIEKVTEINQLKEYPFSDEEDYEWDYDEWDYKDTALTVSPKKIKINKAKRILYKDLLRR